MNRMLAALRPSAASFAWLAPVLAIAAALLSRLRTEQNVDMSGLITWAERTVDGARPYVDFIEINPPGSFLIYVPSVILGRLTGITPEIMTEILVFLLLAWALVLCWRIAGSSPVLDHVPGPAFLSIVILVLATIPLRIFGEREHIGVIALLPILAMSAAILHGHTPPLAQRVAAGLGAALAMVAKPHFALVLGAVGLYAAVATRSVRHVFQPQWLTAATVTASYLGFSIAIYPVFFFETLQYVSDVYLPIRRDMETLLMQSPVLMTAMLFVSLIAFIWLRDQSLRRLCDPTSVVLLIAAAIGFANYLIQGKGWPYHMYPAVALILLLLSWHLLRTGAGSVLDVVGFTAMTTATWAWLIVAVTLSVCAVRFADCFDRERDSKALAVFVRQVAPANPRVMAISTDVAVGHPVVRDVKGIWVQRNGSLLALQGTHKGVRDADPDRLRAARLERYEAELIEMLAQDIERGKPDVIIVDTNPEILDLLSDWIGRHPSIARQMAAYEPAGSVDTYLVLVRSKTKGQGRSADKRS